MTRCALLAALLLATAVPAAADETVVRQTAPCVLPEDEFLKGKRYLMATSKARMAILGEINQARSKASAVELRADRIAIAPLGGEPKRIGIAMFRDHCTLAGSVRVFPLEAWMAFIGGLGLTMDDFVREEAA